MKVKLKNYTDQPEQAIARAARVSHQSEGEGIEDDRRLIRNLLDWGHLSPIEFADATFYIERVSRSCLAQVTRHRLASFMVRSMRYVKQKPEETVTPPSIKDSDTHDAFSKQVREAYDRYEELIESGVPKEDARFILPIGSATDLYLKANFREYRHIITLRSSEDAQWEIRQLANSLLDHLWEIAPSVFEDLKESTSPQND